MKKPIFKKLIGTALLAGALVLLDACYPGGAEFVDELDLITTDYDDGYDFTSRSTYTISEEIPKIGSNPPKTVDLPTTNAILTKIRANMSDRGYTEVDVDADPGMHLLVGALETKTTVVGCGGGGWWGWYPYYPSGCWYPVAYSYSTGSILITLWDKDSLPTDENETVSPEWEAGINGLLQGSESSVNARIQKAIDQAFVQSPYIQSDL